MKRERVPVMNLYEWSLTSWLASDARNTLDAAGRGIYRELLDWCYAQGKIPADHVKMARWAACSVEVFEHYWPVLKRYFKPVKNDHSSLENSIANAQRRQYFAFVKAQQTRGRKGGKIRGKLTTEESDSSEAVASENAKRLLKPVLKPNKTRQDITRQDKTKEDRLIDLRTLDEQWGVFVTACLEVGIDGSGPDWKNAERFGWSPLDVEQRIAAVHRLHELRDHPDDFTRKARPDTYLEKRMWERPLNGKKFYRESEIPEWKTPEDEVIPRG